MKYYIRLAFLILFARVVFCSNLASGAPLSPIQAALALAASNNITQVEVFYYPEYVHTFIAVTPEKLESAYWSKTVIQRFQDLDFRSALLQALDQSDFKERPPGAKDYRWGCVFYDEKGTRLLSIYLDKFGTGLVNQIPVRSNEKLLKLLRTKFAIP